MSIQRDVLYAWMNPYYAVARRGPGWSDQDDDHKWFRLQAEIGQSTPTGWFDVALDEMKSIGRHVEVLSALERMWQAMRMDR
jgi:hypothetical protein